MAGNSVIKIETRHHHYPRENGIEFRLILNLNCVVRELSFDRKLRIVLFRSDWREKSFIIRGWTSIIIRGCNKRGERVWLVRFKKNDSRQFCFIFI